MGIFKDFFTNLMSDEKEKHKFTLPQNESQIDKVQPEEMLQNQKVYTNIDVNLDYIHSRFNSLINSDIVIREFMINVKSKQFRAFIIYVDGMVNSESINDFILKPLMLRSPANQYDGPDVISEAVADNIMVRRVKKFSIAEHISNSLLPQNDVKKVASFDEIAEDVISGNCVFFVDTLDFAFDIGVKSFDKRSIAEPKNETVILGSQEAFVENLRTNTSMIRRNLNNENLVIESLTVGKTCKNKCAVCYIKNVASADLVAEVKYRINNLDIDYLISVGELKQLIKDDLHTTLPEILTTERVDNTVSHLLEGRVCVVLNGSPYVLIMPTTIFDYLSSPEDLNLNYIFGNLLKVIRAISLFVTLLLPGLYIAITTYHGELIPTELLFSIVATRSRVPFMVIVEIILMEVSFEIIREAGLRVPSSLGSTVGIVGALILGQAAVEASIVSPILIIIIAITGLTSFAIPDYTFSFHLRMCRFVYTLLGFLGGFLGIGIGLFLYLVTLCSLKSFGVNYLSPYAPLNRLRNRSFLLKPIWMREQLESFMDTKIKNVQNHFSMKWRE